MRDLWNRYGPKLRSLLAAVLRAPERLLLLALGGIVLVAALGFLEVAEDVAEGDTEGADHAILLAFRNPADPHDPIGPAWLEVAARDWTSLGSLAVLSTVTLSAALYLLLAAKRRAAVFLVLCVAGGVALSSGLKEVFARTRPEVVPGLVEVQTLSFPSGHSMMSAVVYLTLGALLARVQPTRRLKLYVLAAAMLLTGLVGLTRIYLGVHYPSDVLAGFAVGTGWAVLCWLVALSLQRRGEIEGGSADGG